jgi:hypothetical protein
MFSRISTGILRFDREVDSASLPEHIARCLRMVHASRVDVTGNQVTFTAGLFRTVGNWNVLVPFGSGNLSIESNNCEVRYRVSCSQLLVVATVMIVFMGVLMLVSGGKAGMWFLPLMWLWLVGGNLAIGLPRFRSFLARSIADAPRKSNPPLHSLT